MRKLVTVQEVRSVSPIEGADRIEVAEVLGWRVIVGKDSVKPGDHVLYFEVDSLLPETVSRFESFQARGQKTVQVEGVEVTGHVLRTIKMRGVVSQGLVMPLEEFEDEIYHWAVEQGDASSTDPSWTPPVGMDVTAAVGVVKYEEPVPEDANIIGHFDKRYSPKSRVDRVQSLVEHWEEILGLEWYATVKVDGASTTLVNDEGVIRVFSRNWEISQSSDNHAVAEKFGLVDFIKTVPGGAIQFEFAGPGVSKNRMKMPESRPFVFAVYQDGIKIPRSDWAPELLELAVPLLGSEWVLTGTLEEMIEKVTTLRGHVTEGLLDEGVVYHLKGGQVTPEWLGRNGNFKIINNKYLLKHGL